MLSILEVLTADAATITEKEMKRVIRALQPRRRGEKVLGTIHNMEARNTYALSIRYQGMEDSLQHQAAYDSETDDQERELRREALRYHVLHMLALEIFWAQCREDLGGGAWDHAGHLGGPGTSSSSTVGLRTGFALVTTNAHDHGHGGGGGLPGINILGKLLKGGMISGPFMMGQDEEDEDDDS